MKRIVDEDSGERARTILEAHPQLVFALLQIQVRFYLLIYLFTYLLTYLFIYC